MAHSVNTVVLDREVDNKCSSMSASSASESSPDVKKDNTEAINVKRSDEAEITKEEEDDEEDEGHRNSRKVHRRSCLSVCSQKRAHLDAHR